MSPDDAYRNLLHIVVTKWTSLAIVVQAAVIPSISIIGYAAHDCFGMIPTAKH
jgi:hypothetical protein